MVVFVLRACPVGLRGHLTRWMSEVTPGVFVGRLNPRLRDRLWDLVVSEVAEGGALVVFDDHASEGGFSYRTHRHHWHPIDIEGLTVMMRPSDGPPPELRRGWSPASRLRRKPKEPGAGIG